MGNGFRTLRDFCIIGALALAPIVIFIPIDLWLGKPFHVGPGDFALFDTLPGYIFHEIIRPASIWFLLALSAVCTLWTFAKASTDSGRRMAGRRFTYVILVFLIGPVLLTNVLFKDNWHRPRPRQTIEMDGKHPYQPPILIAPAKGCGHNCSFVSGDAAAGFATIALAIAFARGRRRKFWIATTIGIGLIVGVFRMAAGAHYFSDVIYSGFLNVAVAAWFYPIWMRFRFRCKPRTRPTPF